MKSTIKVTTVLSLFLLFFVSSMSYAQMVAKPDAKLLDAAIEQYLKEMKSKFSIAPAEFIIEAKDPAVYTNVKKKVGSTAIVIKTKKELQGYSAQKTGKNIGFFVIDVEKVDGKFSVDIMDDGIKSVMENGAPAFAYKSFGVGRACVMTFSSSYAFEDIDCLLLPTDPGQ
jgi:hypothetical protein